MGGVQCYNIIIGGMGAVKLVSVGERKRIKLTVQINKKGKQVFNLKKTSKIVKHE